MSLAPQSVVTDDPRRDPELLQSYLLGDQFFGGPGLISRVQAKLYECATVNGLQARSGSVIGMVDHAGGSEDDSERVLDLALALLEWRRVGIGRGHPKAKQALVRRLKQWRVSDLGFIFGHYGGEDLLHAVRQEVKALLEAPTTRGIDRCVELARYLVHWYAPCDHPFETHADLGEITVRRCPQCGSSYGIDRRGRPLAI